MKIESVKDLEAVIKLCRKTGVKSVTIDGVAIELGDAPQKKLRTEQKDEVVAQDMYTDEQLMFWSSGAGQ